MLNPTRQQLQELLARLNASSQAFDVEQKYLALALGREAQACLFELAAAKEQAAIAAYLAGEEAYMAESPWGQQLMRSKLRELEAAMEQAAELTRLVSLLEDHQLRGQIRFLKHFLEDDSH